MSSQKKSKNRQKTDLKSITRPYRIVSYISLALFASLIGYMVYFQVFLSDNLLNSPYNKRQEIVQEQIVKGSLLDRSGNVLAETVTAEDGTESRNYPYGNLFAQAVGYSVYGGSGLESTENSTMLQSHADIVTQMQQDIQEEKKQGDNVTTTLSAVLQQAASDALGSNRGAVFAMDADTGEVLVDYSSPNFNPNTIEQDWESLVNSEDGVFLNRATQGQYPPGSTFKIVTALAYYRQHGTFDDFSYTCTGSYESDGYTIHCAGNEVHGQESFQDAMANSCNCAFAYMAVNLIDKDLLRQTADQMGFNQDIPVELPYNGGEFTLDANTPNQLTMQTAIGQGDTLATPMLMCMVADAVKNNGQMMTPIFVKSVDSATGSNVKTMQPQIFGDVMTTEETQALEPLLEAVVQRGTAADDLSDLPYQIAGKTGTAEYGDVSEGKAHSWFTGYTNTGNNDIVVCAVVENGGNGRAPATQVARNVFSAWGTETY